MKDEGITVGAVLKGRETYTLIREVSRTDAWIVYVARNNDEASPWDLVGITFTFDSPGSEYAWENLLIESTRLVRLSDFGSWSKQLLGRRGLVRSERSSYAGMRYYVWTVMPHHIQNPYPNNRTPRFTPTTRRAILTAAGHQCQVCGSADALQLDHIVPIAVGGSSEQSNGQVLCQTCHRQKTAVQHRLLAIDGLSPETCEQFYHGLVDLQLIEPPYYLKLPDISLHFFWTSNTLWQWITLHAGELFLTLPPAPTVIRWGLGVMFEYLTLHQ